MSRSVDVMAWTETGRAALDEETQGRARARRDVDERQLRADVGVVIARFGPCWERGSPKSDDAGREAVAFALGAWDVALERATVEQLAGMASLLGARSDDDAGAFTELVVRRRGFAGALRMLVRMWSLCTNYDDPDWPDSEKRLAIWLRAMGADDSSAQDCSVSHAKGDVAYNLAAWHRAATDAERADASAALAELWPGTPLHARAPVAVACRDQEHAEEIASDLFAGKTTSHPHFAWDALPVLIRDPALIDKLHADGHLPFSYAWLDALGVSALPYYDAAIDKRSTGKYQRERMVAQLLNVRGPRAAAILSRFADKAPFKKPIREYFARHPELTIVAKAPAKKTSRRKRS
jgi:hypothetical protein